MKYLLFVALGGAFGAVARYSLGNWVHVLWSGIWPLGTMLVNVVGSAAIGVVFVLLEKSQLHPDWRSVLLVGFLGAFTTFSTFSLESVELWQTGHAGLALLYALLTTSTCILAAAGGMYMMRNLL